jgi:hypothetical protein
MPSGLYADMELIERFQASVSAATLAQPFLVPCDLEVQGLLAYAGTAPGSTNSVTINCSNSPTSQIAGVSAYNLWTAANAPVITGSSKTNFTTLAPTVIKNVPYALNYPLPGAAGTAGYVTAQSTSQTTQSPVLAPPTMIEYGISTLVPPDNTYTDLNGITGTPASYLHAGDILSFVISGASLGSVANLEIVLFALKR